jgi:hypothetical protein
MSDQENTTSSSFASATAVFCDSRIFVGGTMDLGMKFRWPMKSPNFLIFNFRTEEQKFIQYFTLKLED